MAQLTSAQRALLLSVAERIVPASSALDGSERAQMMSLVEEGLALRPDPMQRQFAAFLQVLRWAPILRYGRRLDHLRPDRQDAVLHWFQDAPVQLLRSGFWGMRTLVFLGYYGMPEIGARIGYRPSRDGNTALHDR